MKYLSVYQVTGRPVWYASFPDPKTGKRIKRASEFRIDAPMSKRRALEWARDQAREGALIRDEQSDAKGWAWVEPWLRLKYRQQKKTLANSLNWWSWLMAYFEEKHIATPRALERTQVLDYIPWRMDQKKRNGKTAAYNTALHEVKFLGRVMREAIHRRLAEQNPAERLGLKKDKPAEKPEITDEEIAQIRAKLHELEHHLPLPQRWRTISFELAIHHGCREAEVAMPMDRIDLRANTIRFHAKRGEIFTVPLNPGVRGLIERLQAAGAKVTCALPKRVSLHWHYFFKGRRERDRNIPPFLPHLCFHCTRVTVITRLARAGVPIQQTMAYVHHASELIHRIYQRLKPADVVSCHAPLQFPQPPAAVA